MRPVVPLPNHDPLPIAQEVLDILKPETGDAPATYDPHTINEVDEEESPTKEDGDLVMVVKAGRARSIPKDSMDSNIKEGRGSS